MSKVTVVSRPNRIVIASKGVQGAVGPEGPEGIQGVQGEKGDTGDVTPEALAARDAAVDAADEAAESADLADQARLLGATIGFATKANMDASLAHPAGTLALVTNDATPANNGTYRKTGASGSGSWVQSADRVTGLEGRVAATEPVVASLKAEAETGAYVETFAGNSPITVTNLSDAVTPAQTYVYGPSGLTINLATGGRTIKYSTKNKVGGRSARITVTQAVNSAAADNGVGFAIGSNYYFYAGSGRTYRNGALVSAFAPVFTAPVVITTRIDWSSSGALSISWSHAGGVASLSDSGVVSGDFSLVQRGTTNVTHAATFESVGALMRSELDAAAAKELADNDRAALNALHGLLASLSRAVPTGLTATIPYDLSAYKVSGTRDFFTNIDLRPPLSELDSSVTVVHVDPVSGLDSNGGSAAAPYKSLSKAVLTPAQKLIVKAKPGLYDKDTCWAAAVPTAPTLQVVPWGDGDIISSCHHPSLTWTLVSGSTYSATVVDCGSVADVSVLTADGDYTLLTKRTSQAAVDANAGSWYISGTTLYVRTHDSREPDASIRAYRTFTTASNGRAATDGATAYCERVKFHGGQSAFYSGRNVSTAGGTLLFRNCEFKYAAANGLSVNGAYVSVLQSCTAAHNNSDGFNYHAIGGSGIPQTIEVDCIGRWNGRDTEGTNNGSTTHDAGLIVRVGGDYHHNQNRNVHDVGGALSWNLGCTSRDSRTAAHSNWCAGISTDSAVTRMWLDTCTSSGTSKDLEAPTGKGVIYTFDLVSDGDNVAGADIQAYQA